MARLSTATTDQLISAAGAGPSGSFSMFVWFKPDHAVITTGTQSRVAEYSRFDLTTECGLWWDHPGAQQSWVFVDSVSGVPVAQYTTALASGTWYPLGCTWDGSNLKAWNGSTVEATTPNGAGPHVDAASQFTVFQTQSAGVAGSKGTIAAIGIWDGAVLTAGEFGALARGERLKNIRPKSLKRYWDIDGLSSPEPDYSGNADNLTITGTSKANGPPMTLFTQQKNQYTAIVPAGGVGPAIVRTTNSHSSGSWYLEGVVLSATAVSGVGIGLDDGRESLTALGGGIGGITLYGDGHIAYNGTVNAYTGSSFAVGDTIALAWNEPNALIFYSVIHNGVVGPWNGSASGNPVTLAGGLSVSGIGTPTWATATLSVSGDSIRINLGGSAFTNPSPPPGYEGWAGGSAYQSPLRIGQQQVATVSKAAARTTNISQGQVIATTKGVGKTVAGISQQQLTAMGRSVGKNIVVSQAQVELLVKAIAKAIPAILQSQSVLLTKALAKTIPVIPQSQTTALSKLIARTISLSQAQQVTLTEIRQRIQQIIISQAQIIGLTKFVSKTISVSQAQSTAINKIVGKVIALSQNQSVILATVKSRILVVTLTISQSQIVSLVKNVAKTIGLSQAQITAESKTVGKLIGTTQSQQVTLSKLKGSFISIAQSQSVVLAKLIGKTVPISQGQATVLVKQIRKTIGIGQQQSTALLKSIGKTIAGIVQTQLTNFARQIGKAISISQGQSIPGLNKFVGKTIGSSQSQNVAVAKAISKIIAPITQNQSVVMRAGKLYNVAISIQQSQIVSLLKAGFRALGTFRGWLFGIKPPTIRTFIAPSPKRVMLPGHPARTMLASTPARTMMVQQIIRTIPYRGVSMPQAPDLTAFDAIDDQPTCAFDFGTVMPPGITIPSVASVQRITVFVHEGKDANAANIISGAPTLGTQSKQQGGSGLVNMAIFQTVIGGVGGVTYGLQCVCKGSDGKNYSIWGHWPCQTPS